jgi:hypothetical protein
MKISRMARRTFTSIAVLSALLFLAVAVCFVRQYFVRDDLYFFRWNPTTKRFTETRLLMNASGFMLHSEATTARPVDNTAGVFALAGPANSRVVHVTWPARPTPDTAYFWFDHYRCTPANGLNQSGLSDCWTVQARCELPLALFATCPLLWAVPRIIRAIRTRSAAARGFAVIADSGANAN